MMDDGIDVRVHKWKFVTKETGRSSASGVEFRSYLIYMWSPEGEVRFEFC
jgi:hypothetical protein